MIIKINDNRPVALSYAVSALRVWLDTKQEPLPGIDGRSAKITRKGDTITINVTMGESDD